MATGDFYPLTTGTSTVGTGGLSITTGTSTGLPITIVPSTHTLTFPEPVAEVDEPELAPPKCFECGKEVQSVCTFVQKNTLVVIIKCHNEERRIDVSLKRFKGDKFDAIEWFSDTFQWVFDEESKWRRVKPDSTVSTIHADRKILSDWLDNI